VVDMAGYFGNNHRLIEKFSQSFKPLTDLNDLVKVFAEENKLVQVMKTIRSIDRDKNGYVTNQELEDILKLHYNSQLQKFDLKPLFKEFCSQSNRLLINYSSFKERIIEELAKLEVGIEQTLQTARGEQCAKHRTFDQLSPTLNRRTNSTGLETTVAGKSSIERNYSVKDALHGYDRYAGTLD